MPVDRSKLDELVNQQITAIEQADEDVDYRVTQALVVLVLQGPNGKGEMRVRFSGDSLQALGMLEAARSGLLEGAKGQFTKQTD